MINMEYLIFPLLQKNFSSQLLGGGEFGDDRDDSSDLKYGGGGGGGNGSRDDSFGPGDLDGRATMVPPSGISTMRVSSQH